MEYTQQLKLTAFRKVVFPWDGSPSWFAFPFKEHTCSGGLLMVILYTTEVVNRLTLWVLVYRAFIKGSGHYRCCQRLAFTVGVSQHMHKMLNCENLSSIGHRTCEIIMKQKIPLSHEVVCVSIVDFKTSKYNSEVSKSNSWKLLLSRKLRHLRGSHFLQCFIPSTSPHYS